jgi:hypothetical protein
MRRSFLHDAISPSMVVALLALFVALGGTAWASHARTHRVLGADIVTVVRFSKPVTPGSGYFVVAMCPRGYRAIGGGAQHVHDYTSADDLFDLVEAGPVDSSELPFYDERRPGGFNASEALGWFAVMRNVSPAVGKFGVEVVCARVVAVQR